MLVCAAKRLSLLTARGKIIGLDAEGTRPATSEPHSPTISPTVTRFRAAMTGEAASTHLGTKKGRSLHTWNVQLARPRPATFI
jgi:hypothetical protein